MARSPLTETIYKVQGMITYARENLSTDEFMLFLDLLVPEPEPEPEAVKPAKKKRKPRCRLCGKSALEIGGYLQRVNETGIDGIWECRQSCTATLSPDERVVAAIEGEDQEEN